MKPAMLVISLLLLFQVAFGEEKPEATATASNVEMVITGEIQPGQPKTQTGDLWWGLCETDDGGYELVQTSVIVDSEMDLCINEIVPVLLTDVNREFLFLVRGSAFFEAGRVKTEHACRYKELAPGEEVQIRDFGQGGYTIFAAGDANGYDVLNYSMSIREREKEKTGAHTFMHLEHTAMNCEDTPHIIWVGDIDRDNKPDIFLDAKPYPGSLLMLFLSSEAQEGEIVHKIAVAGIPGC